MLNQLFVQNVALVDQLELHFEAGMSVITGETGAGKSIMLDALGLALGDRADTGLVAGEAEKAEVIASFDLTANPAALRWLAERDLNNDGNEAMLRRVVTRDGRSRGYINGSPVTVTDLRDLGDLLLDLHSQHEHQSLLRRETHRRLLDEFGDSMAQAGVVSDLARRHNDSRAKLATLVSASAEQSARVQLLTYQANELETLAVRPGETGNLEEEQKLLSGTEEILRACSEVMLLCEEDEEASALARIARATHLLGNIDLPRIHPILELLESSSIQLTEAMSDLGRFVSHLEQDPARLKDVEDRLSTIYDLARKHRVEPGELPSLLDRISAELLSLANADSEIETLGAEIETIDKNYREAAKELSMARRKAARRLTEKVSRQLASLGMSGARFEVALTSRDDAAPHPNGAEEIEFLISTNPGQAPRSLGRIASGGELSRISLAIQVVTAATSHIPTLVFDEVDVGIGGGVAEVVGSLLRQLGNRTQVICVTHLPQVAAQGHQQYRVSKSSGKKRTRTQIERLTDAQRIEEIARMLGGLDLTDQSLAHARAMFEAASAS
ncbi:MAG: DNA repair protein RecN [Pseudomonadota bacterium]